MTRGGIRWSGFMLTIAIVYGATALVTNGVAHGQFERTNSLAGGQPATQDESRLEEHRCVALEIYTHGENAQEAESLQAIREILKERKGVALRVWDLDGDPKSAERLATITRAYGLPVDQYPVLYGLNTAVCGIAERVAWEKRVSEILTVTMFARTGCDRCAAAKKYLPEFQSRYPGIEIEIIDVLSDPEGLERLQNLVRLQRVAAVSFPAFWIARKLSIGFDSAELSGPRLDAILKIWTFEYKPPKEGDPKVPNLKERNDQGEKQTGAWRDAGALRSLWSVASQAFVVPVSLKSTDWQMGSSMLLFGPPKLTRERRQETNDDALILPMPPDEALPEVPVPDGVQPSSTGALPDELEVVSVPVLGSLSVKKLGLPLFTILVGLVDGFNPCAMWVLLFLLSVLVTLHDRWKILIVAGTFVVISGAAYYAFMAAWLNVFLLVGYLRWVQVILALIAIAVGTIHVKDFIAFKKGISLSIPESAKPGLYRRMRAILNAEHIMSALVGATVLAVLVNVIELLCTAGMPALYNQILSLHNLPMWANYSYLGLYIVAYMFDDILLVGTVVITLGRRKLQEREGRWLKLVSGLVILLLGVVLLLRPDWLI